MEVLKMSRTFFYFILQFVVSFIIFRSLYVYDITTLRNDLQTFLAKPNVTNQTLLIILLWTYPFGNKFPLNQCPEKYDTSRCFYTANRRMYPSANAVIIHHLDVCKSKRLLPRMPRPRNQYWIWLCMESPSNILNLDYMDNLINMTMSYRLDSDIFTPYGWLEQTKDTISYTIPKKTKLVAWVLSHWDTTSRRVQYYDQLKEFMNIDVYGKGHLWLSQHDHLKMISTYKFYLAFENSVHEDYITEKLWQNSFLAGTVPIVLGPPRANYERFIPPDSFIHVDDFSSPQELASYLFSLDKDDEKYKRYFKWRSNYTISNEGFWEPSYCKVCKSLREAPSSKTIPSIVEWFK